MIQIRYEWWALHFRDRSFWTGVVKETGEVFDYNSKAELKRLAEKAGHSWEVLRYHRDGRISVVETSP